MLVKIIKGLIVAGIISPAVVFTCRSNALHPKHVGDFEFLIYVAVSFIFFVVAWIYWIHTDDVEKRKQRCPTL